MSQWESISVGEKERERMRACVCECKCEQVVWVDGEAMETRNTETWHILYLALSIYIYY